MNEKRAYKNITSLHGPGKEESYGNNKEPSGPPFDHLKQAAPPRAFEYDHWSEPA